MHTTRTSHGHETSGTVLVAPATTFAQRWDMVRAGDVARRTHRSILHAKLEAWSKVDSPVASLARANISRALAR